MGLRYFWEGLFNEFLNHMYYENGSSDLLINLEKYHKEFNL